MNFRYYRNMNLTKYIFESSWYSDELLASASTHTQIFSTLKVWADNHNARCNIMFCKLTNIQIAIPILHYTKSEYIKSGQQHFLCFLHHKLKIEVHVKWETISSASSYVSLKCTRPLNIDVIDMTSLLYIYFRNCFT